MRKNNLQDNIFFIVTIAVACVYSFMVLLDIGFVGDNSYNSLIKGVLLHENISIFQKIINEINGWTFSSGRIFILNNIIIYGLFYLTQNPLIIHTLNIIILFLNIYILFLIIQNITNQSYYGLLVSIITLTLIQFRYWHDPILIFPSHLLPIVFLLFLLSVFYFLKYLQDGSGKSKKISVIYFVLSLVTYEVALPLVLIFPILAFKNYSSKIIHNLYEKCNYHLNASLIYLIFFFYLKFIHIPYIVKSNPYPTFANFNFLDLINALIIQLSSSLPLSYLMSPITNFNIHFFYYDYLGLVLISSILFYILKKIKFQKINISLVAIGFYLLLIPAFIAAISGHQKELLDVGYGFGYLPVFIQYFGFSIIFSQLFFNKNNFLIKSNIFNFFISLAISSIFVVNVSHNRSVAMEGNLISLVPTNLTKSAFQSGIFDDIPNDNNYLFRQMNYTSDYFWSYSTILNKKIRTCELAKLNQKEIDGTNSYIDCIDLLIDKINLNKTEVTDENIIYDITDQNALISTYYLDKNLLNNGVYIIGELSHVSQNLQNPEDVNFYVKKINTFFQKTNTLKVKEFNEPYHFNKILNKENVGINEIEFNNELLN